MAGSIVERCNEVKESNLRDKNAKTGNVCYTYIVLIVTIRIWNPDGWWLTQETVSLLKRTYLTTRYLSLSVVVSLDVSLCRRYSILTASRSHIHQVVRAGVPQPRRSIELALTVDIFILQVGLLGQISLLFLHCIAICTDIWVRIWWRKVRERVLEGWRDGSYI